MSFYPSFLGNTRQISDGPNFSTTVLRRSRCRIFGSREHVPLESNEWITSSAERLAGQISARLADVYVSNIEASKAKALDRFDAATVASNALIIKGACTEREREREREQWSLFNFIQ